MGINAIQNNVTVTSPTQPVVNNSSSKRMNKSAEIIGLTGAGIGFVSSMTACASEYEQIIKKMPNASKSLKNIGVGGCLLGIVMMVSALAYDVYSAKKGNQIAESA